MRIAVFALLVAAGITLIGGSPGAAATPALTWKVDSSPFRVTVLRGGAPLLRQHLAAPGPGSRLSYSVHEVDVPHTLTDLVSEAPTTAGMVYTVSTTEPDRLATVTVTRKRTGVSIALVLGEATTTVRAIFESFDSPPGEHFLGTGERRDVVDLRNTIVPIKVWHDCGTAKPAPFYLSSRGYGVRFATTAVGRMAFGTVEDGARCQLGTNPCRIASFTPVVQACFKANSLAYEVYVGSPDQIVRSYGARTGKPPLPDPSQFALMKWRDHIESENELTEDVDRFARAGIPLGWVIVDNPWEKDQCVGSMTFDPTLFPTPRATVARLHARGVRVMMWVSPAVQAGCGRGLYPRTSLFGTDRYQAIDLTDPAVVETFVRRLGTVLATGVDGFKVDRGDEVDFELEFLANASGADAHNAYPLLLARAIDRAARATRGRPVPTLFRAGFTGSQRLMTGTWSGDLTGNWNGLEHAIHSAQTAGLVGFSTWGSDVGGYIGSPSANVFVRWSQLGAVSPVFEVGGAGLNARPWKLGPVAMNGLRVAAILHYELFPYHYALARKAAATGVPILRPLAFDYPTDEGSWRADRELLIGNDLLAAPVTRPGTRADVYLPPGRWVDLGTGATREGPLAFRRQTPLEELPLFLREGAAIPFNLRKPDVWAARWGLNDQFRPGRGSWLVAPGSARSMGSSAEYGTVKTRAEGTKVTVALTRARRETQVLVLGRRPVSVRIDGRDFPPSPSAAALRTNTQGWVLRQAPFAGIVVKLAPRAGRANVSIEY